MTTPTRMPSLPTTVVDRSPLRLRLQPTLGDGPVDGTWWPQSRELSVELADLVDNFAPELGQVQRVVFSRPDWDSAPHRVRVARGLIKVGSYPRDDMHQLWLSMSINTLIRLSVVAFDAASDSPARPDLMTPGRPPSPDEPQGDQREPDSYWNDDGDAWWAPHPVPPSERT